jgi:hypothetical protein
MPRFGETLLDATILAGFRGLSPSGLFSAAFPCAAGMVLPVRAECGDECCCLDTGSDILGWSRCGEATLQWSRFGEATLQLDNVDLRFGDLFCSRDRRVHGASRRASGVTSLWRILSGDPLGRPWRSEEIITGID